MSETWHTSSGLEPLEVVVLPTLEKTTSTLWNCLDLVGLLFREMPVLQELPSSVKNYLKLFLGTA